MSNKPSGKLEKRAKEFCEAIAAGETHHILVEWRKSRSWGWCPVIESDGEVIARASGCGYDKLSAVLWSALRWLAPDGKRLEGHAAGWEVVRDSLAGMGWNLMRQCSGPRTDVFEIESVYLDKR